MKFLNNLDLQQNQLLNARAHSGVAPTNPKEGMFYYNTTDDNFWVYTGDGWKSALYVLPTASNTLGGIKAAPKAGTDTVEVKIGTDDKLYVPTYPVIPDITLVGNTGETNKYISSASVDGHKITFNKGTLPSETDPIFTAWDKSTGISITKSQVSDFAHTHVKADITDFTHDHDDRYYTEEETNTLLNAKLNTSLKGAVNGLAELGSDGKVPSGQLPSYVDDVLEYANLTAFPANGESGKIYVALDTNKTYRWSGSGYIEISASLALGETSSTAYRGDRGKIAYDHTSLTNNPHSVTTSQIGAEPAFTKNTAFNKNFGTTLNTVAQGNHLHTGVYEPANANIQSHISSILNPHSVTKTQVGLGNVDNTSDANKPVSTATQTELNKKVDKETGKGLSANNLTDDLKDDYDAAYSHTSLTNNPHGVTKTQVGLGNVDNTSDANKPVSTATQTELNKKVDKETGKGLSANNLTDDLKDDYDAAYSHTSLTNNPHGVTTTQIGAEPEFSKNTAFNKNFGTSLNTVAQGNHLHTGVYEPANANIQSHISSILNPHSVTKAQVGLDNVDNTSDLDKPVSTAQQAALDDKVDKETGKGLSTNDYTTLEKNKLANIASGAEVNVQSDWEAASGDAFIKNKPVILTKFIDEITLSDGVNGIMSVEHGLGTKDVIVSLRDSFDEFVYCNVTATTANQIQIKTANVAVGTVFRVTIIG